MRRSKTGVGIYVISLDTFMLLAVLGITIGVLFIIISPMLDYTEKGIKGIKKNFTIDKNELNTFIAEIPDLQRVDQSIVGYPDKELAKSHSFREKLRWYKPDGNMFGQIRKIGNNYNFLRLLILERSDQYFISITGIEGIEGSWSNIDSVQDRIIEKELNYWPELKDKATK